MDAKVMVSRFEVIFFHIYNIFFSNILVNLNISVPFNVLELRVVFCLNKW